MRKIWRALTPFLPLAAAAFATLLTYLLVALLAPRESYVYKLFYERSWIQHATTFCFWLTMAILLEKVLAFRSERDAFEHGRAILAEPQFQTTLTWTDAQRVRQRFQDEEHRKDHASITFTRIARAMDRLHKTQSTSALEDYFRTRSDIDSNEMETGYTGVRYLTWLIPTLGFVGTVWGIGIGISGFADIIQNAQGFQEIQRSLPVVTGALGTAFDTTLLALGLSAVAVFSMSELLKRQERLLEQIDNLCFDEVCALFKEHSTATVEIVEAIGSNVEEVVVRANGNRAQLEDVIRRELPELIGERVAPLAVTLAARLDQAIRVTSDLAESQIRGHQDAAGRLADLAHAVVRLADEQKKAAESLAAELRELRSVLHPTVTTVPPPAPPRVDGRTAGAEEGLP